MEFEYLPPASWKAELRMSREQTNMKRRKRRRGTLKMLTSSGFIPSAFSASGSEKTRGTWQSQNATGSRNVHSGNTGTVSSDVLEKTEEPQSTTSPHMLKKSRQKS